VSRLRRPSHPRLFVVQNGDAVGDEPPDGLGALEGQRRPIRGESVGTSSGARQQLGSGEVDLWPTDELGSARQDIEHGEVGRRPLGVRKSDGTVRLDHR
jgi:hypothetical protein